MKKTIFFLFFISLSIPVFCTQSIINLEVLQYPTAKLLEQADAQQTATHSYRLYQPDFTHVDAQKRKHKTASGMPIAGIEMRYLGNSSTTDHQGQIYFERGQINNTIHLVVTKQVTPVFQIGPTLVAYWQVTDLKDTACYTVTLHQDTKTKLFYFSTKKSSLLAIHQQEKEKKADYVMDEKQIPLNSIIILAEPNSIEVPLGRTLTTYQTNLLLPTIYSTNIPHAAVALLNQDSLNYFEKNKEQRLRTGKTIQTQIRDSAIEIPKDQTKQQENQSGTIQAPTPPPAMKK